MVGTILVPLAQDIVSENAFEAAFLIAKRMNSQIRALFVRPDPDAPILRFPEIIGAFPSEMIAAGIRRETPERETCEAIKVERARFDAWRSRHEIPNTPADTRLDSCSASWVERVGEIGKTVTHFGRVSDLIVMSRIKAIDVMAQLCFDAAVFGSGRPTLLAPEKLPSDLLDHIMIAWNGSLEASHAVFGAMPLLRAARRVSIFSVPEEGTDNAVAAELAEALSWSGIRTRYIGLPEALCSAGDALLTMARQNDATLVVMGAYTHSHLRQVFFGGVTRQVLSEATVPVLMSH
jgi:nucleotide-binding universal stress UspA family protein